MTNYKHGDIVLVLFPDSNLQTAKKRPALIIQADNLQTGLPQVIVAMITSNMKRAGHPSRVTILLNSFEENRSGLQSDSVIVTDNLATVQEKFIYKVIGNLSAIDKANAKSALAHTFGLNPVE
ncbi:MAG: type II toxin-antitoxin system PemK/MazF family toxin [Pyrinomonadaceae bacterium]